MGNRLDVVKRGNLHTLKTLQISLVDMAVNCTFAQRRDGEVQLMLRKRLLNLAQAYLPSMPIMDIVGKHPPVSVGARLALT